MTLPPLSLPSLSLTQPAGAVFWALVAIAIAALARVYRAKLMPPLRRLFTRFPGRIIPVVKRTVYAIFPTLRSHVKVGERTRSAIQGRITQLQTRAHMPMVVVGGIYLDLGLAPVSVTGALNTEYSDLDTIPTTVGGSAYFVGRYLWKGFTRKSYLFSRVGRGDFFSRQLARLVKESPWIRGDNLSSSKQLQCGISVHLLDKDTGIQPTFTHKGAVRELTWGRILRDMQHCFRRGGGVLYISGYFRTGLSLDFTSSIRALSPDIVVILDHGRFRPGDDPAAENALFEAFRSAAVDIYICTYAEIKALARAARLSNLDNLSEVELVEHMAQQSLLPKTTIVRGDPEPGVPTAIAVVDRTIEIVQDGPQDWIPEIRPGAQSAFTAGFINALYDGGRREGFEEMFTNAVKAGLRYWAQEASK
jgi:hypothetical protein